ncbi:MAG: ABC transporter permease [Ardenticatenaceae bacterium]|nr:ABC transporter permease [Ardenticatenaceae bacterium]
MAQKQVIQQPGLPLSDPTQPSTTVDLEIASQWKLMWWKFRKHKLAMAGGIVVLLYYFVAILAEFFAPSLPTTYIDQYVFAPPQRLQFFQDGRFDPFVYGYGFERDPVSFKKTWLVDEETVIPVGLFVRGDEYTMYGLITSDLHFIGPEEKGQPFYLLGSDKSGRDIFSRIIYSSRVSLTVGLVGVAISLTLGILMGGLSGLVGGWVDNVIQRLIELLMSIPNLPIWLALAAVVPIDWPALRVYFMTTLILAVIGQYSWTYMARVVRSRFLSLREEDFVLAAMLDGCSTWRLIFKHMVPSFLSHIIASVTLAIPGMIIAETALSFLGLGLRPPVVSWGVMLQDSQKVGLIATSPWLLYPGLAVFIVVLALNFFGDGIRDAADPYH